MLQFAQGCVPARGGGVQLPEPRDADAHGGAVAELRGDEGAQVRPEHRRLAGGQWLPELCHIKRHRVALVQLHRGEAAAAHHPCLGRGEQEVVRPRRADIQPAPRAITEVMWKHGLDVNQLVDARAELVGPGPRVQRAAHAAGGRRRCSRPVGQLDGVAGAGKRLGYGLCQRRG